MKPLISPLYQIRLAHTVKERLFAEFTSYDNVRTYIEKWHERYDWDNENFSIYNRDNGQIDALKTLHHMDGELLLKIAVDVGVETPDYIPTVATFKNELKSSYKTAYQTFEKAMAEINEHPDIAVGLVNSALESILKEICKDPRLKMPVADSATLYDLSQCVLKAFSLFPTGSIPTEIRGIGSGLLKVAQQIEALRSTKTKFHGRADGDYRIDEPLLAQFVVNTATTVGLFLINYYKAKFPEQKPPVALADDDLPF